MKNESQEAQEKKGHGESREPETWDPKAELKTQRTKAKQAMEAATEAATKAYWRRVMESLDETLKSLKEEVAISATD